MHRRFREPRRFRTYDACHREVVDLTDTASASTYTVERSATINADPAHVYAQVVDFHRWTVWSPWEELDPHLQRTYSGPEAGVGATYAWKGNRKAGEGRMEITRADEPETVV